MLFITRLKKQFGNKIKKVILFGSRARGDNEQFSDYDFLVICNKVSNDIRRYIDELENEILLSKFALISTFLISEEEFKTRIFEPYLMNVRREGILL